eukprot:gene2407-2890_t
MAGRAEGGKGVDCTVVLMRSKDKGMSLRHVILTSPVDDIRSHFKIFYALRDVVYDTVVGGSKYTAKQLDPGGGSFPVTQAADEEDNDTITTFGLHSSCIREIAAVVSVPVEDMYKAKCKMSIDCLPTRPVQ